MAKIRSKEIIEAAKQAYTPVKADYSGYVKAAVAVNKLVMDKINLANEQETKLMDYEQEDFAGINKTILSENNTTFLTDLRQQMAMDSRTMKTSLGITKKYKEASKRWNDNLKLLQQLKTDATTFTDFVKKVRDNKEFLSDYQSSLDQSFLTSVLTQPDMINQSVTFTKEGIKVLGADGTMISMEDLPSGTSTEDGSEIDSGIQDSIHNIEQYVSQGIYDKNKQDKVLHDLEKLMKGQKSNAIGSAIFDYEYATSDGIVSYIDVLLDENPALKEAYEDVIEESMSTEDPIDTELEKEKLRKKLIREQPDFNLEKIKDGFINWINDEVFGNASSVAESSYNKKVRNQRINRPKTKEEIELIKSSQALNLDGNTYVDKTPIRGLAVSGGDMIISGTKLEQLIGGDSDWVFDNKAFSDGETEFRLTSDGVLQMAQEIDVDGEKSYKWINSPYQKNSSSNDNRNKYNQIISTINGISASEFALAGNNLVFKSNQVIYKGRGSADVDIDDRKYTEKITHTRGNRVDKGASYYWFFERGGIFDLTHGFFPPDDETTIADVTDWINSMGFTIERKTKHVPGKWTIMNDSGTSNSFVLWAPDGEKIRLRTNLNKDRAKNAAIELDEFINLWYRRQKNTEKYDNTYIEDINNEGQYLYQDKV